MQKMLVSKEEARIAIGYGRRSWDAVIASGELPVIRHGSRIFISTEALENFAKAGRPRMAPKPTSPVTESVVTPAPEQNVSGVTAETAGPLRGEGWELRRRRRAAGD